MTCTNSQQAVCVLCGCGRVCGRVCSELRQVVVPQALQDLDQALESKHISPVRPVVHRRVTAEPLEGGVGEVDHTYVHQGGALRLGSGRSG